MRDKILHLLSGGIDSVVMLYELNDNLADNLAEIHCALFDYKQRHVQELNWAKHHCHRLGKLFTTIELPQLLGSELTDDPAGGVVVPNRNAVMLSFALDNDAYICFQRKEQFDHLAWLNMLNKVADLGAKPLWMALPDAVGDRENTLKMWDLYLETARRYRWQLAFVVQDGMTPADVPTSADVVFVGGTTQWKWRSIPTWTKHFPRVHVGRCGTSRWKLDRLQQLGVESCDGSGFFRATIGGREARQLMGWLNPLDHQPDLVHF